MPLAKVNNMSSSGFNLANFFVTFIGGALIGVAVFWTWLELWSPQDVMVHTSPKTMSMSHGEMLIPVDGWKYKPTLDLNVIEDPVSGWNLNIQTENFVFDAKAAGHQNVEGHGHAHIYVNGAKLGRIYGDWYHIGSLPAGNNELKVSLYANDHSGLTFEGNKISSEITVLSK